MNTLEIQTKHYGVQRINPQQCISFPSGLIGFESYRDYALLDSSKAYFFILQSLEDQNLSFILINPYIVRPDYLLDVPDEDIVAIGSPSQEDLLVFSIVTIPPQARRMSCNLLGPLLINRHEKKGCQSIILGDWKSKHYIFEEIAQQKAEN